MLYFLINLFGAFIIGTNLFSENDPTIINEAAPIIGRNTGNNHKPMFEDCANYSNTIIEEEQPLGLNVTTVNLKIKISKTTQKLTTLSS